MTQPNHQTSLVAEPQVIEFTEPLELEGGATLPSYSLKIETYGTLNRDASNALLICHALTGDHHPTGHYEDAPEQEGWWHLVVGPGKAIDTNRFYVVSLNNLGGCSGSSGPSTINPATGDLYGPDFPIVTVRDFVEAQYRLTQHLQIESWAAVVGGSLGGMQVLEWSIRYPSRVRHAVIIAAAAKLSAQNIAFNEVARQAIRTDPEFHEGHYLRHNTSPSRGLRVARMVGHITYLSDDKMASKFGRTLRDKASFDYQYETEFEIESYLRYQGDQFIKRFDANTYLLMTKALDYFDPAAANEDDLTQALAPAQADFLVIAFDSDWRFSPERSKEIVRALHGNDLAVTYAEIKSPHGHDSFLLDIPEYTRVLGSYLNRVAAAPEHS